MTNEELAIEIQNSNKKACVQLWEQVNKFIIKAAYNYHNALKISGREYTPDVDDFISEGYIAMLEAVKYYSSDKEYHYITYLNKTLKKAFATVAGLRTLKARNDPLNKCSSLNSPIGADDEDTEFLDLLADETSQDDFSRIELSETQQIVAEALAELKAADRQLIKLRYWDERSYEFIGKVFKIADSTAIQRERKTLRKLRLNNRLNSLYRTFELHYKGIQILKRVCKTAYPF